MQQKYALALLDTIMYLSDNFAMSNATASRGRPAVDVPTGNHFGAWLRTKRTERGLTGEALAFATDGGITQSSISHYERGTKKPEAATVFLLAKALGVDSREAFDALAADTLGHDHDAAPKDNSVAEIVAKYSGLPEKDKLLILEMLDRLAK